MYKGGVRFITIFALSSLVDVENREDKRAVQMMQGPFSYDVSSSLMGIIGETLNPCLP
jgi:hypothetical protein